MARIRNSDSLPGIRAWILLSRILVVSAAVYWNPGDNILRHNLEFNHTKTIALSWNPPITINRVSAPPRLEDEIAHVNNIYAKPDATSRLDIFRVEASWLRQMEESLYDLTPAFGSLMSQFDSRAVKALTVNGRLLAIPSFLDLTSIYYRKDLLVRYNKSYPTTWDEFEETAFFIQEEERKTNPNFWGFMWQGSRNEILTLLALQFISTHGGGKFVEDDGTVSINNPNAIAALDRARGWLNFITPISIVNQHLHETKQPFLLEEALFLIDLTHLIGEVHNWQPKGVDLFQCGSRNFNSLIGIGSPPGQPALNNATVPWYWGWAVNKYSPEIEETIKVLEFLASTEQQLFKARFSEDPPTRKELQQNDTITCGNRSSPTTCDIGLEELIFVDRALGPIGSKYFSISEIIFTGFNDFLVGKYSTANDLVLWMECEIHFILSIGIPEHCGTAENKNYKMPFLGYLGAIFFGINISLSCFFAIFIYLKRKNKVVTASQPLFLYFICLGCAISSTSVVFLGRDENNFSVSTLDAFCQCIVWFYGVGFALTVSSLIAKTSRVKQLILDNYNTDADENVKGLRQLPFLRAILFAVFFELIYIGVWQIFFPVKWERVCKRYDDQGYCIDSVGNCGGTSGSLIFLAFLLAAHLVSLIYTLYLCYLVRNIPSDFSEHKWITASAISSLEILVIVPPIVAISWEVSADIGAGILSLALFLNDFGILVMIFLPKIFAMNEKHNEATIAREDVIYSLRKKVRNVEKPKAYSSRNPKSQSKVTFGAAQRNGNRRQDDDSKACLNNISELKGESKSKNGWNSPSLDLPDSDKYTSSNLVQNSNRASHLQRDQGTPRSNLMLDCQITSSKDKLTSGSRHEKNPAISTTHRDSKDVSINSIKRSKTSSRNNSSTRFPRPTS